MLNNTKNPTLVGDAPEDEIRAECEFLKSALENAMNVIQLQKQMMEVDATARRGKASNFTGSGMDTYERQQKCIQSLTFECEGKSEIHCQLVQTHETLVIQLWERLQRMELLLQKSHLSLKELEEELEFEKKVSTTAMTALKNSIGSCYLKDNV